MSELPEEIWRLLFAELPKKYRAGVARNMIATFGKYGFEVPNNSLLWQHAFKPCTCMDIYTMEPNLGHERCDGVGWLKI